MEFFVEMAELFVTIADELKNYITKKKTAVGWGGFTLRSSLSKLIYLL